MSLTRWPKQIFISHNFVRLRSPKSRCQQIWCICIITWWETEREKALSCLFLHEHWSYKWVLHFHDMAASQRFHILMPRHWRLGFNISILGINKHSVHCSHLSKDHWIILLENCVRNQDLGSRHTHFYLDIVASTANKENNYICEYQVICRYVTIYIFILNHLHLY